MKHKTLQAFTLVELIVVITIVWILSTVGFVSYSGYLTGARDSNRFSQLTKLSDSLQVYATTKSLPLPDDYIEITASGSSNVIAYQGYIWTDVLETIDYTNGWKDPKDDSFYTYFLTKDRKNLQLLAFMEESITANTNFWPKLHSTYAADYTERFPKMYWKKLWVLVSAEDATLNTPVQELTAITNWSGYLDVVNAIDTYKALIANDNILQWDWSVISWIIQNSSCKRLRETWNMDGNRFYELNFFWELRTRFCYFENWETIEDMLEWKWDFANWEWIPWGAHWWGGSNEIVSMRTPILSDYAVHQIWTPPSSYQLFFYDFTQCDAWDSIYMTLWLSDHRPDNNVFHARINYTDLSSSTADNLPKEVIDTKNVNWVQWRKVQVEFPLNSSKTLSSFDWKIWWNNTSYTPSPDNFYFTWVRLSCEP